MWSWPDGVGTVSQVDLLRETVKVRLEDSNDPPRCYHNCEICVVRNGKGKRPEGYVAPPPEELEKLRKVTPPPGEEGLRRLSGLGAALDRLGMESPAAAEPPAEKPARSRRDRKRSGQKQDPSKAKDKPKGEKSPKAEGTAPAKAKEAAPAPEGEKKPASHRRRRSRGRSRSGGGAKPAPGAEQN